MEIDVIFVANNIRGLRTTHKESKKDLAQALHVTNSTITNYEKGERLPDRAILADIAKHYRITEDQLLHEDFSSPIETSISASIVKESLLNLFPTVSPKLVQKNEHFERSFRFFTEICEKSSHLQGVTLYEFERAFEELEKAEDDERIIEPISVNTLALWYLFLAGTKVVCKEIADNTAIVNLLVKSDELFKREISSVEIDKNDVDELEKIFKDQDIVKEIAEKKRIAVNSEKLSKIGYYYLALGYLYDDVNNELPASLNKTIGEQMMISLADVGNPYAQRFMKTVKKMMR